jgi:P27 family predicted phage terminase small subunit
VPAIDVGIVTSADRVLAIAHCELWSTWQALLVEAAKHPHVIAAGPNNYPIPNPARGMANKTLLILTRVDDTLGFSPTSRSRVDARPPAPAPAALDRQRARFFRLGERG